VENFIIGGDYEKSNNGKCFNNRLMGFNPRLLGNAKAASSNMQFFLNVYLKGIISDDGLILIMPDVVFSLNPGWF
jgi:hypothetical protein